MKNVFLVVTLLALTLVSCEKNQEEPIYEDFQSSTLLRQVGENEDDMQILTYYNSGKIFEHLGRFYYRKYIYNSEQKLQKIEISLTQNPLSCAIIPGTSFEDGADPRKVPISQYVDIEYGEHGKIAQKTYYYMNDNNPVLMSYEKLDYEDNKIVKSKLFNPQDQLTQYHTYSYDEYGNVNMEEYYFVMNTTEVTLQSRIEYEYDNKTNPFSVFAVEGSPGINSNKNNITKQITTNFYEGEEHVNTLINTYEYNDLGYPVSSNNIAYIYGVDE